MWGSLDSRPVPREHPGVARAVVSLALRVTAWSALQVCAIWVLRELLAFDLVAYLGLPMVIALEFAYVFVCTLLDPHPDYQDIGFGNGALDNPVAYSDNWNRMLLTVAVFSDLFGGPGRWVGHGFVRVFSALLHGSGDSGLRSTPKAAPPPPARPLDRWTKRR
jgi:hypothetical protein